MFQFQAVVFDLSKRNGTNACTSRPCSDLCLPVPGNQGYVCECPDHRQLTKDQHTCEGNQLLVYEIQWNDKS